jgi:hypothetical protein
VASFPSSLLVLNHKRQERLWPLLGREGAPGSMSASAHATRAGDPLFPLKSKLWEPLDLQVLGFQSWGVAPFEEHRPSASGIRRTVS